MSGGSGVFGLDGRELLQAGLPVDCASALLGEEGRGFHMMMSVLEKGRIGIAALAVGIAQAGLEAALEYSQVRKQFGKAISDN